jgi:hypothetical protein
VLGEERITLRSLQAGGDVVPLGGGGLPVGAGRPVLEPGEQVGAAEMMDLGILVAEGSQVAVDAFPGEARRAR